MRCLHATAWIGRKKPGSLFQRHFIFDEFARPYGRHGAEFLDKTWEPLYVLPPAGMLLFAERVRSLQLQRIPLIKTRTHIKRSVT
jgi:hypothetical protein